MLPIFSRRALIAATGLAFVTGCSGASSLAPSQQSAQLPTSQMSVARQAGAAGHFIQGSIVEGKYFVPAVAHPLSLPHAWPDARRHPATLFVADPQQNEVLMYDPATANPSPLGSITTGIDYPFGLAMDKSGTLYVANLLGGSPNNGSITVYPKGATSPSLTIVTGMVNPYGVAVDSTGEVFATMLDSNTIVGYKAGATTPFETISFAAFGQALGITTDAHDNLWIGSDSSSEGVWEIPAGTTTPQSSSDTGTNGTIDVAFGLADLEYAANFGGSDVTGYKSGTTTPFRTITDGIETHGPTFGSFTASGAYFQSNQDGNVSGYHKGKVKPFSTITGIPDPRGIVSFPLVKK
jgi:hypothetical protein